MKIVSFYVTVTKKNMYGGSGMNRKYVLKTREALDDLLAKLDGTAKGGVAIPIRQEFNLPVKYIGLGEQPDDLALFNVDTFVDALFDAEE